MFSLFYNSRYENDAGNKANMYFFFGGGGGGFISKSMGKNLTIAWERVN